MKIIAGKFRGRPLQTLSGFATRPTTGRVREAVFNILQSRVPGCRWLDLFAGSGAMAFEALSRGAAEAVLVEHNPRACQIIRANIQRLGVHKDCRLIAGHAVNAAQALIREGLKFALVYIDPPYQQQEVYQAILQLAPELLETDGLVLVEHPPAQEISLALELADTRRYGATQVSFYRKD